MLKWIKKFCMNHKVAILAFVAYACGISISTFCQSNNRIAYYISFGFWLVIAFVASFIDGRNNRH